MPSKARQKKIMEKLNRAQKCSILGPQNLGSGGGLGPRGPPLDPHLALFLPFTQFIVFYHLHYFWSCLLYPTNLFHKMAGILYPTSSTFVITFLSLKVYSAPYALPPVHPINPSQPHHRKLKFCTDNSDFRFELDGFTFPTKSSHGELRIQI